MNNRVGSRREPISPTLSNKQFRKGSIRRGSKDGVKRDNSATQFEDWVFRLIFNQEGKIKDAYTSMLRDLMIDPEDLADK